MSNEQERIALDCVDVAPATIVDLLRESIHTTLRTRLEVVWREQNPGEPVPGGYAELTLKIDHKLLTSIVNEVVRNTAQVVLSEPLIDPAAMARALRAYEAAS